MASSYFWSDRTAIGHKPILNNLGLEESLAQIKYNLAQNHQNSV
jgi:hypothetical protein